MGREPLVVEGRQGVEQMILMGAQVYRCSHGRFPSLTGTALLLRYGALPAATEEVWCITPLPCYARDAPHQYFPRTIGWTSNRGQESQLCQWSIHEVLSRTRQNTICGVRQRTDGRSPELHKLNPRFGSQHGLRLVDRTDAPAVPKRGIDHLS